MEMMDGTITHGFLETELPALGGDEVADFIPRTFIQEQKTPDVDYLEGKEVECNPDATPI
jgi:hypothetical protein